MKHERKGKGMNTSYVTKKMSGANRYNAQITEYSISFFFFFLGISTVGTLVLFSTVFVVPFRICTSDLQYPIMQRF
jgi:hypothetical protein